MDSRLTGEIHRGSENLRQVKPILLLMITKRERLLSVERTMTADDNKKFGLIMKTAWLYTVHCIVYVSRRFFSPREFNFVGSPW